MDDERARVIAKNFIADSSKRGRPKKRWKEAIEKGLLIRALKKSDAQDRAVWRLRCKNRLPPVRGENKMGSKKTQLIVNTPETNR